MEPRSTKGWTWGNYTTTEDSLILNMDNKLGFGLNFRDLTNVFVPGKNEVALEFAPSDANPENVTLCELRLHVPETADELNSEIMTKANISSTSGDSIVSINDIPLIIPRGKYILDMYADFIKLHGKTNTYKIMNKNITRTFLLPHADNYHISFVIGLDSAIRQGNTMYPYIVIEFNKEREEELTLNLPTEQIPEILGEGVEDPKLDGALFDIISKLFKQLVKVQIIIPGTFRSVNDQNSFKCSVRANPGFLFPLQKSMIFVNKPVIYIRFEEIRYIEFQRVGERSMSTIKSFDLHVITKDATHQFTGIDREEYKCLLEFFEKKKLNVRKTEEQERFENVGMEDEDEDDQSDYAEESEEDASFHGSGAESEPSDDDDLDEDEDEN